jgi:hypothetical protein
MAAPKGQRRAKNRGRGTNFAAIPKLVIDTQDYMNLTPSSLKLLWALVYQSNGKNNGDLTAALSVVQRYGFNSKSNDTLNNAKELLIKNRLIVETRAGTFTNRLCSLYALTWLPIDECKGKLSVKATSKPLRDFGQHHERYKLVGIPKVVMRNPDYFKLSGNALRMLIGLRYQYNKGNNGYLKATTSTMTRFGFKSDTTLIKAKRELLQRGFILEAMAGQFSNPSGRCALYAITWEAVDENKIKLDIKPTRLPPRNFHLEERERERAS